MTHMNIALLLRRMFVLALAAGLCVCGFSQGKTKDDKNPRAEDVVERAIAAYGSRAALYATQRNGTLRANVKFNSPEGAYEAKSVTKFIRKPKLDADLMMIELDLPGTKYTIGFDGKETWALQDGQLQTPTKEAIQAFHSAHQHSYEALLRYKENDAKLEYVSNAKLGTLELDTIELIATNGTRTRYEISRKTGRIIYINFEERPAPEAAPTKYRLYFKDFRVIQNTLVPYETQVYKDGKLIEERKIVEAAFNVQLEDKAFKAENANKPTEAVVKQ